MKWYNLSRWVYIRWVMWVYIAWIKLQKRAYAVLHRKSDEPPYSGVIWYVGHEAGDDGAEGTLEAPLRTISAALDRSGPGDVIYCLGPTEMKGDSWPIYVSDGGKIYLQGGDA